MNKKRILTGFLALTLTLTSLCLGPSQLARAATITVNTTNDELNTDGDCSLREAIQAANTDTAVDGCTAGGGGADTIILPAGQYTLSIPGVDEENNATGDLDITWYLTINGAGDSTTFIQAGTNGTNGIDRVLDVADQIDVEINDVTIRFGDAPDLVDESQGGGIRSYGDLTLNNCSVGYNTADYGGGIYMRYGGDLTLNNSIVALNWAGLNGGGINTASSASTSNATLNNSTITANHAGGSGGGIRNDELNSLIMNNSDVTNNTAANGGGISNNDGTLTLDNCTISGNDADFSGGGIENNDNPGTINNCTISGNHAGSSGGGIYDYYGTLTIDNSTISGNTADSAGGGIYHNYGVLTLNNSTVADNTADMDNNGTGQGGGVGVGNGLISAMNTLIADNQDRSGTAHDCFGPLTSQGYNLVEDTTGCTFTPTTGDVTGSDPNLGALADNGGPTHTHALQTGSPAIEQIPDGTNDCQAGVSTDQRGYPRAGGTGLGGALCDIGAYEDADGASMPTIQFLSETYTVREDVGSATITVVLNTTSGDIVRVDYATSNGTATAGSDYSTTSGTLEFYPGDTSLAFTVPIADDMLEEADETVALTLSNATNALIWGNNPATLTIIDEDPLPTVSFSAATYNVNEGAGSAAITVNLSPPSGRLVEVDCATSNGTATAGSDYTTTGELVYFYPGDTSKTFTVPIINDELEETNETVILTLSDATNATIGTTNPATLTIIDNDGVDFYIYLPLVRK